MSRYVLIELRLLPCFLPTTYSQALLNTSTKSHISFAINNGTRFICYQHGTSFMLLQSYLLNIYDKRALIFYSYKKVINLFKKKMILEKFIILNEITYGD